jgi:UDP-N-acetylenolpyruvoylglucosamine reductase
MNAVSPKYSTVAFAELARSLSSSTLWNQNEPLARRTTFRVGGPADFFLEPGSEHDLASITKFCREQGWPLMILGRGSNLLIRDGGIRGVVVGLGHPYFSQIQLENGTIRCGAGARLKNVAVEARRASIGGLEFLEGIPGSVGGALRMNAGAMGGWMFAVAEVVRYMDQLGAVHEVAGNSIDSDYRSCAFFKDHIALGAVFRGEVVPREIIEKKMMDCSQKRWKSQPAAPSAGCIFKNPETIPSGRLIEELGLKGTRVGGAAVSEIHGNFIVNDGTATARDILDLIQIVKDRAVRDRGIVLETEVEIVGEDLPEMELSH